MKILTATARSQGARPSDFDWCIEGELVWVPEPCEASARSTDTGCGCVRAFGGLASHRSTTTAVVRDLSGLTPELLIEILAASLRDQGWPSDWAEADAQELMAIASRLDEGDVVERHGDSVGRRFHPVDGRLLAPLPRRR
jgi:hypothetical protein